MKQGLLFKEAHEPRVELFCFNCKIQFHHELEFENHRLKIHDQIPGMFRSGWGSKEISWFNVEYTEREDFTRMHYHLPKRPARRWNVTEQEAINIENNICWCGKTKVEFEKHQIKYCCKEHNDIWWDKTDYVNLHKNKFLNKNKNCAHCGFKGKHSWNSYSLEMDHIIAIMFGGHPWDERNLQALCHDCHVKKTRIDRTIQKFWRDTQYYDPVFTRGDTAQQLLESFTQA